MRAHRDVLAGALSSLYASAMNMSVVQGPEIANDDHHVAILHEVGFIGEPSLRGNHQCAAHLIPLRHRQVDDLRERIDAPLQRSAGGASIMG